MIERPELSPHALAELQDMARGGPIPRCAVNPGVARKLENSGLAECVMLPSPFRTHRGGKIQHCQITDAGRQFLSGKRGTR